MMPPFLVYLSLFHVMTFHVLMVVAEDSAELHPYNNSMLSQRSKCIALAWGEIVQFIETKQLDYQLREPASVGNFIMLSATESRLFQ